MIEYTEQAQVVDSLRYCANNLVCGKKQCPAYYDRSDDCFGDLLRDAADMIESKHRLIEELRREIEREERCGL